MEAWMGKVADFERELGRRAIQRCGRWFRVDLHNHTPTSYDYRGNHTEFVSRTAQRIAEKQLSIVMFTDHERLPDPTLTTALQSELRNRSLILRGVELNVFVDAFNSRQDRVEKEVFYHLLIGFDPEGKHSPEYWLEHLYRECRGQKRPIKGGELFGVPATPEEISKVLAEANAIVIPAHLHTVHDPLKSRSVDDIYGDKTFLDDASTSFTALEVVDSRTAEYFDGRHPETRGLLKACIRSSDSHEPDEIGRRWTWVEMESPSYDELVAALKLPFRTSLVDPALPAGYVVGMRIQGAFFPDQWIQFSPHCNMLIAVKGSGKTSVLECLRFALGADVPTSRAASVNEHLAAILGTTGTVQVLLKRSDGARLLAERTNGSPNFNLTFEDDRTEQLKSADALNFPTHILGWHEIEQAATDPHIRRVYMDTIAGKAQVRALEEDAKATSARIREQHAAACQKYAVLRDVNRQVESLRELRKGLQALSDANLLELKAALQTATEQREAVSRTVDRLRHAELGARERVLATLASQERTVGATASALTDALTPIDAVLAQLFEKVEGTADQVREAIGISAADISNAVKNVEDAYSRFLKEYEARIAQLSPEQRRLLDSHREVLERTKALGSLEAEEALIKKDLTDILRDLAELCDRLAKALDNRTAIRREAVARLNGSLKAYDVQLSLKEQERSQEFQDLSSRYSQGASRLGTLSSKLPARLASLCLRSAYGSFAGDFSWELGDVLFDADIGYFISAFENDDLLIALKVGKVGEEFSPIDKLSAGQRCTAVFPILLEIGEGVLVVDQPEDNLDNRHIAAKIAPALLVGKWRRQMMFTSHNANLVVLSDAEAILMFESDGATGRVEEQGYFATSKSVIARHVIDVLDGGPKALEMRSVKYGIGTRIGS
jgi:hypothetical protein